MESEQSESACGDEFTGLIILNKTDISLVLVSDISHHTFNSLCQ